MTKQVQPVQEHQKEKKTIRKPSYRTQKDTKKSTDGSEEGISIYGFIEP